MSAAQALTSLLRAVGLSQVILGVAHVVLWRLFGWSREIAGLSPLTARVFSVHTFFVAFVVAAFGALALARPDLLAARSDLARLLLGALVVFWGLRLVAQPVVFDPVLLRRSRHRAAVRAAAMVLFASYVLVYGWAFARQLG
jgi:hypothetical protein